MSNRPFFVVNPRSAGGETGRIWDVSLRRQIVERFPEARWAFTAAPGHGSRLAEQAWKEGADLVVAVGGDGTVNEVVNGLMGVLVGDLESGLPGSQGATWPAPGENPPRPVLGVMPRGTGCDFVKSLGIPKDFSKALEVLATGRTVPCDLAELQLTSRKGQPIHRYCVNICGCGANGEVVDRVNRSGKQLGGFLSFFLASLATTMRYHTPEVEIRVDDGAPRPVKLNVLFVCNAQYCGGGMRVGKGAVIHDGLFQVVEVAATGRATSILHGSKLYSGKMDQVPGSTRYTARKLQVSSSEEVLIDCDGEQPGILPATFTLIDKALQVRVGSGAVAAPEA
jgi:diacylglycerol kinase family enzyme